MTNDLAISDFATIDAVIPRAKVDDYAKRIFESLVAASDDETAMRSLSQPNETGSRVLQVGFTLQAMAFSVRLEYSFTLAQLKLDPMDLLSARLTDLEVASASRKDEGDEALKNEVASLKKALDVEMAKGTKRDEDLRALADAVASLKGEPEARSQEMKKLVRTVEFLKTENLKLQSDATSKKSGKRGNMYAVLSDKDD